MIHIIVLLRKCSILFRRVFVPSFFRGTVCVPLDFLLLLYFHVFSGLSVLFFSVYVQLRQNVPSPTQNGAVPLPAADLLAHTVSTPKQCERYKESHQIASVFRGFWRHWKAALRSQRALVSLGWMSTSIFLTHVVIALISCISNHPWLVSIVHKILLLFDLLLVV